MERESEREREIERETERAKEKEIERENVEWILIRPACFKEKNQRHSH